MINLLLAMLAGVAGFLAFYLPHIAPAWGCVLPAILVFGGAYFLLARRTGKQFEQIRSAAEKEMMARKPERAVAVLQDGFKLARWQFGMASGLHANIGILLYVQKKFDEAEPHLRKSGAALVKLWLAQAMLGAILFRKKQYEEMEKVFNASMRGNKNETLLYAVYAWCENQRGEKKKAIEVLQKGVSENASDEKLKGLLNRAQNDKRLKLDPWGEQWWQFWLETPPMMMGPGSGAVFSGRQRFGRGGGFRR